MNTMLRTHVLLCATALVLVACTTPPPPPPRPTGPADFGVYAYPFALKAVSADRVVYEVQRLPNKPLADQGFWQVALKERLVKTGYVVTREGAIESAGKKGYYIETMAPRGTTDYVYLVALFVQDQQITLVESAGALAAFEARRDAIFAAIKSGDATVAVAP